MEPDLSQRVATALHVYQELNATAADRYLHELRRSDPEVALKLDVLLCARGSAWREELATGRDEAAPVGTPPARPDDAARSPGELPTGSVDARATASFADPGPPSAGRDSRAAAGQILGRYQLLRVVGRGAFGEVWQAYDPVLQKHVAVKAPLARRSGRPIPPTAFLHEARKVASLRHPAIVQVYDVGESGDGWYIVSEFVEGDSLRARLEAGRLPIDLAARVIATVAGALHAAHLAGLVHRDVKPANIMLDRAGNAYLTDFGLAVREDEQFAERSKVSGTLAYMPPEQIRGDTHLLDGRADVYALGAVLYELLTGRLPFRAESYNEYLELILRREPRPPRSIDAAVPEELERICLKCLAKEVKDRYRTAEDLAADLEAWLAGLTRTDAPAPAPAATLPRWVKPAVLGAVALSLLAAVVGVVTLGGLLGGGRSGPPQLGPVAEQVTNPVNLLLGKAPDRKVPTVKELIWPRETNKSKWEILPETNQLKVYADSTALLQVGETSADSWELSATLWQLANAGRIGLFLGYRKDLRTSTAAFELIRVEVIAGRPHLQRSVETYRIDRPFTGTKTEVYASAAVKALRPENTLRLAVRGGQLSGVWFNGEPVADLMDTPLRSPADGAFGVFNRNSDGVVSNLVLNGKLIPLLADASPLVPEKP